jgi:Ca-activated chloride channel family protein
MRTPRPRRAPRPRALISIVIAAALAGCNAEEAGRLAPAGGAPASKADRLAAAAPADGERQAGEHNTEAYERIDDNPFLRASAEPLSTFAVDVDTASYANVRRFLMAQDTLPPPDAVRIEELVNYFRYHYKPPTADVPFAVDVEVTRCPWRPEHRLARIALKGREIEEGKRPLSNLVFLVDVSGSMQDPNKLPLVKEALRLLVQKLGENDRVAVVVYASAEGLALPSTSGEDREEILSALDGLTSGGSTAGGAGIELAYKVAAENFIQGGVNRVILCTDGDFNVGISDQGQLSRLIEQKAKGGVFLTVLGFGMGNLKDSTLETLADRGNGHYAYIDSRQEARKVLVEEAGGTLVTIAKDVKIQVDFNPAHVQAYRLIGYENRLLAARDFADDTKDAGEIGAGHTVTALYEIVPPGVAIDLPETPASRYQDGEKPSDAATPSPELLTVALRYKAPDGDTSQLIEVPVTDSGTDLGSATPDTRFAAAVAAFGMLLRDSPHKGDATFDAVLELAESNLGDDLEGYRREFLQLVRKAKALKADR